MYAAVDSRDVSPTINSFKNSDTNTGSYSGIDTGIGTGTSAMFPPNAFCILKSN